MSEELKLKPCPLCGGKADFWGGAGAVLAGCSKCNIHTIYCYPPEDAARVWNSRPAEDEKIVRIAELEAERDRLREALQEIKHVPCRKEGGMYDSDGDWYVNECSSCRRMHDIAREALKGAGE